MAEHTRRGPSRQSSHPHHALYPISATSSPGLYAPIISSPLVGSCHRSSSPVSYVSSSADLHLPSSPPMDSLLPLSDVPEAEPEGDGEQRHMQMDMAELDDHFGSSPRIGVFHATASSSPGPSWLPALQPSRHEDCALAASRRASGWKQPISRRASRPASSVVSSDTPLSSPTPLSRAYVSRDRHSDPSPSQMRQQAANRLRAHERASRLSAHRPLLDAFCIGSRKGIDETGSEIDERMVELIGRRDARRVAQRWRDDMSSEAYATDELIEAGENSAMEHDFGDFESDVDPSQIYAAYELERPDGDGDVSMSSTASTVQPDRPRSLLALLTAPPALCPACACSALAAFGSEPADVRCTNCAWSIQGATLALVDGHFQQHGAQPDHSPVVGYNIHVGTNFLCSNPACDEMISV